MRTLIATLIALIRWIGAAIFCFWLMLGSSAADQHHVVIECQPVPMGYTRDIYGPKFEPETFEIDTKKKTGLGPFQFVPAPATFTDAHIEWVRKIDTDWRFKFLVNLTERTAYRKEYLGSHIELLQFHSCKQIAGYPRLFPSQKK